MTTLAGNGVHKIPTGIPGFDFIADGGLPVGRTVIVAGTAGSGKTIFATQFIAAGIREGNENGVFVTFEEQPNDIRRNMRSFGWNIAQWEEAGRWAFVDASPEPHHEVSIIGDYDFGALLARIEHAVHNVGAKRVVLDSIGAIFSQFPDPTRVRFELFRISSALKNMAVTAVMTAERTDEYGDIARHGIEEFVADNVIILRNALEDEKRRRTIEILKFRGTTHHKGEYPFTVMPEDGIIVIPLSAIELKQRSGDTRVTSGSEALDQMTGGGLFRDSIILVSGATGTGKTLMVTHFINGGAEAGERCLLLAYEESREQLGRNAIGWGVDFDRLEAEGRLKVICEYPESMSLEDHLVRIKREVDRFKPDRLAMDSLSALERISTMRGFREFVLAVTSFMKHKETTGLFTSTTPTLTGGTSVTEAHISSITDTIVLLRYVELFGEMRRGLTVLKMRGSRHDKDIRELVIDSQGMHVGAPFRNVAGILAGNPMQIAMSEMERLDRLFPPGAD
ncbi:MAG: circadian clock protein KaiC [Rhodospirillales bacterium]|jgi:circadian clock protein KaiC|nr:circadian clock protein KaiC [Rhodospirillales bacterium]